MGLLTCLSTSYSVSQPDAPNKVVDRKDKLPRMTLPAKFVMVALIFYFSVVIYRANIKFTIRDIGTVFVTKNEKTVQGSNMLN